MEKKSRGETQVMTSSFISPIAQQILPPKEKKKKKTKSGKVKIGSSLYTLLMICCAVLYLTVTRFS
jgi:cytochrome c-type biogenesis protein CcmH/NrfG